MKAVQMFDNSQALPVT